MKTLKTLAAGVAVTLLLTMLIQPRAFGAVAGTASRWIGNLLVFDGTTGNNAWQFDVNGLRADLGSGADDYFESNGTNIITPTNLVLGDDPTSGTGNLFVLGGTVESDATTLSFSLTSSTNAATLSSTVPAFQFGTIETPTANDLIYAFDGNGIPEMFHITTYGPKNSIGNGTAGSGTGFTVLYTGQMTTRVHAMTLTEAALDAAATSDETVWGAVAQRRIIRVIADVTQTFSGGGITDMDVVCGPTAGSAGYLVSFDVDTAIGTYGEVAAEIGASLLSATYADVDWGGTTGIICRFTCVGANCSAATQGSMNIFIEHVIYPTP